MRRRRPGDRPGCRAGSIEDRRCNRTTNTTNRRSPALNLTLSGRLVVDSLRQYVIVVDCLRPMAAKSRYQNRIELLQGTLDMLILRTLQWGPQHGHGIG